MADEWHRTFICNQLKENHRDMVYQTLHFAKTLPLPDDVLSHIRLQIKLDEIQRYSKDLKIVMLRQLSTQSYYKQGIFATLNQSPCLPTAIENNIFSK